MKLGIENSSAENLLSHEQNLEYGQPYNNFMGIQSYWLALFIQIPPTNAKKKIVNYFSYNNCHFE